MFYCYCFIDAHLLSHKHMGFNADYCSQLSVTVNLDLVMAAREEANKTMS